MSASIVACPTLGWRQSAHPGNPACWGTGRPGVAAQPPASEVPSPGDPPAPVPVAPPLPPAPVAAPLVLEMPFVFAASSPLHPPRTATATRQAVAHAPGSP